MRPTPSPRRALSTPRRDLAPAAGRGTRFLATSSRKRGELDRLGDLDADVQGMSACGGWTALHEEPSHGLTAGHPAAPDRSSRHGPTWAGPRVRAAQTMDKTKQLDHRTSDPGPEPLLLRPAEAAHLLAISPRKLWELTNDREVPVIRIGRSLGYPAEDLRIWVAERRDRRSGRRPRADPRCRRPPSSSSLLPRPGSPRTMTSKRPVAHATS